MAYKIAHECNMFGLGKSIFIHSVEHGLHCTFFQVTFGSLLVRRSNTTCNSFLEIGAVVAPRTPDTPVLPVSRFAPSSKVLMFACDTVHQFHNSESLLVCRFPSKQHNWENRSVPLP